MHLFYAEIDESMRATEGGGNTFEGEFIEKVRLNLFCISDMCFLNFT